MTSIRTVFSKYAVFNGRARRSEYWWFALFGLIIGVIVDIIDAVANTFVIALLVELALLLPSLAVGARRLHDTSRTGWWLLIGLIPLIGAIVLIVFFCTDSTPGANQYGENPKGIGGGYGQGGYGQGGYGQGGYGQGGYGQGGYGQGGYGQGG
ncbi:DUF805 domain-containing protein, partial [Jatrophihabitans endophyticus]|uniref:DUF805 domain-containing protein n=1 Tax=Jatrophihabitans endophyticus TaxID=1206085 RepID=UPI0026E97154